MKPITQQQPNNTNHPATTDKRYHHSITRLSRRQLEMATISTSNSKIAKLYHTYFNPSTHLGKGLGLGGIWWNLVEFFVNNASTSDVPRNLVRTYPTRMWVERCHSVFTRAINSSSVPDLNNYFMYPLSDIYISSGKWLFI